MYGDRGTLWCLISAVSPLCYISIDIFAPLGVPTYRGLSTGSSLSRPAPVGPLCWGPRILSEQAPLRGHLLQKAFTLAGVYLSGVQTSPDRGISAGDSYETGYVRHLAKLYVFRLPNYLYLQLFFDWQHS